MQAFTITEKNLISEPPKPIAAPQVTKPQPAQQQKLLQKEMAKQVELEKIAILKKTKDLKQKKLQEEESRILQEELKKEKQKLKEAQNKAALQKELENSIAQEKSSLVKAESTPKQQALSPQMQGEVDRYKAMLLQAVSSNWIVPDGIAPGSYSLLLVDVAPGGVVLDVKLIKSSGNVALDRSAQAAVLKSSPLPVPSDPALFDRFRSIKLTVRPEGIE